MRHATAMAGAAVVAGRAAVDRPCDIGGAADGDRPSKFFLYAFAQQDFRAGESHRGMELAVGQFIDAFGHPGDTDVLFHEVVIRRQVFRAERPVFAVAVEGRGLEVEVAEAVALPTPDHRAPAGHAQPAYPGKRHVPRSRVGLLEVVGKPPVVELVAEKPLDGPGLLDDLRRAVAVPELKWRLVLAEFAFEDRTAGVHERDLQPRLGEPLARPPARRPRPDHDDVKLLLRNVLHELPPRRLLSSCEPLPAATIQMVPRFISPMMKSHDRTQSAMMLSVGFWHAVEVNPAPSVTNRLLTSWVCWNWLRTDFLGSLPMRAMPTS